MQARVTRSKTRQNGAAAKATENGTTNGTTNGTSNGTANGTKNGTANGTASVWNPETAPLYGGSNVLVGIVHRTIMPLFLICSSPCLVIVLWYTATKCDGSFLVFGQYLQQRGYATGMLEILRNVDVCSPLSVKVLLGYMGFAAALQLLVPGPRALGPITAKGNVPVYKDNGLRCYFITMGTFAGLTYYLKQHGLTPTVVYDHFDEFLCTMTVFSLILCAFLTFKGLFAPSTSDSGSTGNPIMDFYWGTELYPRIFGLDIKVFTNCRFGMTVWPLLCTIFALKNYEMYGFVDSCFVTWALQMIYFTKFFWWEIGYMRTIDIMVDRAGFYICWGCLVYVPGLYASVSLYMANHPVQLGTPLTVALMVAGVGSIAINFLADEQKRDVRESNAQCLIWGKKPDVIRAKYRTEEGVERESLLLVSGWWGVARHFHYVPELALSLCWSLPAGFTHIMPYTYFLWLVLLLTHRTFRDDDKCARKYGAYWSEYRRRVPYKMLPGLF